MSELRRSILMGRMAWSLVIWATSPCSCNGSPRCNCSYSASVSGLMVARIAGAVLSGWFEAGRYPGVAVEEVAEGIGFAEAPFDGGGQVGLDDREVGESFDGPPGAS